MSQRLAGTRRLAPLAAMVGTALGALSVSGAAAEQPCFDVREGFRAPLRASIALGDEGDRSAFGTYRDGTDWAATRAIVRMPIGRVLAKLRDHRNVKDMNKTRLVVRSLEKPGYLELCQVDVEVLVRALFIKVPLRWTEEWAYRLREGTPEEPALVVVSYQKIAGTAHIQHQCGSYVLRPLGREATDLALYDEVRAKRRSAQDTRNMHRGILRNIREDRWMSEGAHDDPRVQYLTAQH